MYCLLDAEKVCLFPSSFRAFKKRFHPRSISTLFVPVL